MTKSMKRIHKVVVKRMYDESPDTSWLGEYSDKASSEFSIDRAHDLDCAAQTYNEENPTVSHDTDCAYRISGECDCGKDHLCSCGNDSDRWDSREYRYFNPSANYVDAAGHARPENTPEEVRKYVAQDYARMEAIQRGDVCFIGIRAEAELNVPSGRLAFTSQEISSGGLWGIESDSGEDYIKSVEDEELASLRTQLHELGFSQRAISAAFRNVEHSGDAR